MTENGESTVESVRADSASSEGGRLGYEMLAEFFGTFLLLVIGLGAVAVSIVFGSPGPYNLEGVALTWAIIIALAIYGTGAISGAHFNPAVSIAFAVFTDFPWRKVIPYIASQFVGAFAAAACVYLAFSGSISAFEAQKHIVRGQPGSQATSMIFTTYAPNPAIVGTTPAAMARVSLPVWFFVEALMTALLLIGIFYLTDESNEGRPLANVGPLMIGVLIGTLILFGAPLTMTSLNPARDLAPRLFTLFAGWGPIAFPGPREGFWIPTVADVLGALLGGAAYHLLYKRGFPKPAPRGEEPPETVGR